MAERRLTNWLKAYLAYTDESESPEEYHKWTAISTIAGAMRRQSFYDMGYFLLYPNMYIVLVGPAGRCKKSTAMRIGRGMLSSVPGINFTTDSVTRERLIQDLTQAYTGGHSSMTAYSSEFGSLLTSSGMDMVIFLTDIFDSPIEWSHKTKTGGTNKIKAPYLNLEAGTTPEYLSKAMPLDTVGIGLTSRIIFVYQDTPRVRDPFPTLSKDQVELRHLLVEDLVSMSQIQGEYKFAPGVRDEYAAWYKQRIKDPNPTGDPRLNGYYERKPMHLLKLAMIVAASNRDETVIELQDFLIAKELFDEVEEMMPKVFANVGKNPLATDYEDVLAAIKAAGGSTSFGRLLRQFKHSVRKEELQEVIETLIAQGDIMPTDKQGYKVIQSRIPTASDASHQSSSSLEAKPHSSDEPQKS